MGLGCCDCVERRKEQQEIHDNNDEINTRVLVKDIIFGIEDKKTELEL